MSPFVTPPNIAPFLEQEKSLSLYIHVPFCASRCIYCDFYSTVSGNLSEQADAFIQAMLTQLRTLAALSPSTITSIYFGGGTPSLLGISMRILLEEINTLFNVSSDAEITIEANPESLEAEVLEAWRAAGANRISLGVQSFDNGTLHLLGRVHTAEKVEQALDVLRSNKWRFSLDLIAGIPGVSMELWEDSIARAMQSGASHMSIYPLAVEEGTPLDRLISQGVIPPIDEDISADQMIFARHELQRAGFEHYEISNFAQAGSESRHNTRYWTGGSYLGLGPGAASMLQADDEKRIRFALHETLEDYLEHPASLVPAEWEDLSKLEAQREDIMLGLRLFAGVDSSLIKHAGLQTTIDNALAQDLIEMHNGAYRLTERGWLLGNEVFTAVWCEE